MERLKYISSESFYEGVIVEVEGGAVAINLKGRLGQFRMPNRMLISQVDPQIGQEVGFMLSYPEVLSPEPNEEYLTRLLAEQKHQEELKVKNLSRIERELKEKRAELAELEEKIKKLKIETIEL